MFPPQYRHLVCIRSPGDCSLRCSYPGCGVRATQVQQLLGHLETQHGLANLGPGLRRLEYQAGKLLDPQKCAICQTMFDTVSDILVSAKTVKRDQVRQ